MSDGQAKVQIGKNGLTDGVLKSLDLAFKKHKTVRIHLLKSSIRDRNAIPEFADNVVKELGGNFTYKILGFTIIMRRKGKK